MRPYIVPGVGLVMSYPAPSNVREALAALVAFEDSTPARGVSTVAARAGMTNSEYRCFLYRNARNALEST